MCTSLKCNLNEIRRFKNIEKGTCSKCSKPVGLAYRCESCNKIFVYNEVESRRKLKAKKKKKAAIKAKWHGGKAELKDTLYNNSIIKKCPSCSSDKVSYISVKQREKEAETKTADKKK
ncbi:MAG: hypothetical protein KOO69_02350 [Victivallales bacterium]|nr:hypothetical protein [Victivallales bacterium]